MFKYEGRRCEASYASNVNSGRVLPQIFLLAALSSESGSEILSLAFICGRAIPV